MTAMRLTPKSGKTPAGGRGRGLVRVRVDKMADLRLEVGVAVAITARRWTHAWVMPAPRDTGKIKEGEELLRNAECRFGSQVELTHAVLPKLATLILKATGTQLRLPPQLSENRRDLTRTLGDKRTLNVGSTSLEVEAPDPAPAGLLDETTTLSLQAIASPGHNEIGGLSDQIARVPEVVTISLLRSEFLGRLGVPAPPRVLFTRPPGTGKIPIAQALAHESEVNFIPAWPTRIILQLLSDAERSIAAIYTKARRAAPCAIFFDDLDALPPRRLGKDAALDRIVAQALAELDCLGRNVGIEVLAATSHPVAIDPALTPPGRFRTVVPFGPPDRAARQAILAVCCRILPLSGEVPPEEVAAQNAGISGEERAGFGYFGSPLDPPADFTAPSASLRRRSRMISFRKRCSMREFDLIAVLDGTHAEAPAPGLQMVHAGGMTAVLSIVARPMMRLPQSRVNQLIETAAHLKSQEACMIRAAMLPARQSCGLTLTGASAFLLANLPLLKAQLARFTGMVQVQITVSWRSAAVLQRFSHEPELAPIFAQGSVKVEDLQAAISHLALRLGKIIGTRLDSVALEITALPVTEDVLWNGALLVPHAALANLDSAVEAIDAIWPEGLQIRQIGPAPVSSFALLEVEPVSMAMITAALSCLGLRSLAEAGDLAATRRRKLLEASGTDPQNREAIRSAARIIEAALRLPDPGKGLNLCRFWAEGQAASQIVPSREVA